MQGKISVRPEIRVLLRSVAISFLILLSLARTSAAKATVDFDPQVDFSKFKTFTFIGGVENLVMLQIDPDLMYTRIHRVVVRELEKKGLHEVAPNQNPDLVVRYWVSPESQVNVAAMGNWAPYAPYIAGNWAAAYNSATLANTKFRTLILDLIDPKSKSLVWRVYLGRKVSEPEKEWKRADDELAEGFKSFPPSDKEKADKSHERQSSKGPGASN